MKRSGGELIVDVLHKQGVERIYGVPGESFLAVLDALFDLPDLNYITTRHEGAAAMMADADGKMTGRPGVAMVTRGPGATNAYAGVHVAAQDSTPMILLVGLIGRGDEGREAFQEIDLNAVFGSQAKLVRVINDAARIPEILTSAVSVAMAGRPGPVIIGLPEDMLRDQVEVDTIPKFVTAVQPGITPETISTITQHISAAQRPFVIVGGETWTKETCLDLGKFAANWSLPVATSFRATDRMHPEDLAYAGDVGLGINPALVRRIQEADLLLVLGARLGDCTTFGYTLLTSPVPGQKLIHVHPSAEEIGRVFAPELGASAGMVPALSALADTRPDQPVPWADRTEQAHTEYLAWSGPTASTGAVNMADIIEHLNTALDDNAILTNGAGNYATWLHRFYRYRDYRTQLAPTSGTMGYGLPAAIAAKLRYPDRQVICLAGDGCLQMTLQELGTNMQYDAGVIVLVINNGMYGTIRMHQERNYPNRISGTEIQNPDFVTIATGYGMKAVRIDKTADFVVAFDAMLASGRGGLIEIMVDPNAITIRQTIDDIRASVSV